MKKTLIALALTVLPVAAMADVTLYGQIKGGLEYTKVKGTSNTITNVNDWGSRIGFKGEEDLGNGLKAIWQIEQKVSLDSKSGDNEKWASRDSFIGVATPFGTVRAGHLSDQINDMYGVDQWEGGNVATLGNTFARNGKRHTGVRYDTPEFAGFSANVLYSPEDNTRYDQARKAGIDTGFLGFAGPTDGIVDTQGNPANVNLAGAVNTVTKNKSVIALGLNYENSGFFAQYGYTRTHGQANDKQVHLLEGGYDANNIYVGLAFQVEKDSDTYKDIALSGAYTMGNITPKLSYAHGFETNGEGKYDHIVAGVDYAFSKRTTALFSVGYFKAGDYKATSTGLGLHHKF